MKLKADPRGWIAAIGGVAVVASVIAGYLAVGSPNEARDQRLDEARLATLQKIATGAQCAYTFTGQAPGSIDEIRADFLEHRLAVVAGECRVFELTAEEESAAAYRAEAADRIVLCADFRRPSPEAVREAPYPEKAVGAFPEFLEPRPAAGRHCYRIRLVKQLAAADGTAPPPKDVAQPPAPASGQDSSPGGRRTSDAPSGPRP